MSSQELPQQPEVPSSDIPLPSSPSPVKTLPAEEIKQENGEAPASSDPADNHAQTTSHPLPETHSQDNNTTHPPSEQPPPPQPNPHLLALQQKHASLQSQLSALQATRADLISTATLPSGLSMPQDWSFEQKSKSALASANEVIKEHIALLHSYNEMKDIGQGLMGLIAEKRGVRVGTIMEEFGMGEKD